MSDTANTAVTAQWGLVPNNTKLGHTDAHHWCVTNDYRVPVILQVPPSIFTESSPNGGFKIQPGGNKTLDVIAKGQRVAGNFAYTISTPNNQPPSLTGNLDVKP